MKIYKEKHIRSLDGFTLMELMTVIAIISILSVIAIPNFFAWRQSSKLNTATRALMSDLSMARMHAIKSYDPSNVGVKVIFTSDGYTVFIDDDSNNAIDVGEEVLRNIKYPKGIYMSKNTFNPSTPEKGKTIFNRSGAVSPAGTITLNRGSVPLMNVIVSLVGRIRVETV